MGPGVKSNTNSDLIPYPGPFRVEELHANVHRIGSAPTGLCRLPRVDPIGSGKVDGLRAVETHVEPANRQKGARGQSRMD